MKQIILLMVAFCVAGVINTNAQVVAPMITAKYKQSAPYNSSCPNGTATGCGPLAIAQILNMYKMPSHGYGKISYESGKDHKYHINVDFSKINFDWDNILDEYKDGAYTDAQAKAVADLMYACGAAMHATYGTLTDVKSYTRILYGLQHYLHFCVDSRYLFRKFYSTAEWIEMLDKQLRDGHPVLYRGTWFFNDSSAGHMFVIDGIDTQGAYHINFGNGGSGDKFADINVINLSGTHSGGRGVCYNASQAMMINCYPTPDYEDYPLQRCILDEPIILNNDITINNVTVSLGETFTLSCKLSNYGEKKGSIQYNNDWALVKDGTFIDFVGQETLKNGDTVHINVMLPENLQDGTYKLELYSKSDLEPEWAKVWVCAPTNVEVSVTNGKAVVTIPENHRLDPMLYLDEDIKEVDNDFAKFVPGRSFALPINNPTTNNFENNIKLDIVADGSLYSYEAKVPVFSQTNTELHILVPQAKVDLEGKNITSVTASYYYDLEKRYVEITTTIPSSIETFTNVSGSSTADIYIYSMNGIVVKKIRAQDVNSQYGAVLKDLPHGIYIVKEGNKTRKIVI